MESSEIQKDVVAAEDAWVCSNCEVQQTAEATFCQMCRFARPLDRHGVPQIFSGYSFHFNGIIPRTIMHPSHSVEWRMAERHGATCCASFDPSVVTILIYRPGYERSEKCRACIENHTNIFCVPIAWMMDSLLQSRQIHPSLYRLKSVPPVANPTGGGANLPHHQHPFYQMNKFEYSIPTSFPTSKAKVAKAVRVREGVSYKALDVPAGMEEAIPPFFDIEPFHYTTLDVCDAVLACDARTNADAGYDENDEVEARRKKTGIELIVMMQSLNRVDRMLFSGMSLLLTPSLQRQEGLKKAIERCGGKLVTKTASVDEALQDDLTHILYTMEDQQCRLMVEAAKLINTSLPGLQLVEYKWVEDCLILGELLPFRGVYTPSPQLMKILSK
ncbi:hypothetical protein GH5_01283 [Leishmania sp. Ghana 2012 LV757]|uniref:hypothetical protein n=1 Tax=Leishmania sp. Ghana 2012 LV757 TaxID=2803181 RepID=UPI001B41ADB9|nr:hypothetical protein GH5_01283 [Leishmania sp. Ghana 2012 LV757]